MASTRVVSKTHNSITFEIYNLSYPANQYDEFSIDCNGYIYIWTSGNTTTNTRYTVPYLSSGVSYSGSGSAKWKGSWNSTGSASAMTLPAPLTGLSHSNVSQTSAYISWSASAGAVHYQVYRNNVLLGTRSSTDSYFTGLSQSTYYNYSVHPVNANGELGTGRGGSFTTLAEVVNPPTAPTGLKASNITTTGFTVSWNPVSGATGYYVDRIALGGGSAVSEYTTSTSKTYTGLAGGSKHSVCVEAHNSGGLSPKTCIEITLLNPNPRPSNWSWSYNIASGGAVQNTVNINGQIVAYIMSVQEWHDFTTRINEFRLFKGLPNASFTSVGSGSNCTSSIINQAVSAINAMGFSISSVNGEVPAWVFNQMRDSLNSIE